jgi:hypothetical protein
VIALAFADARAGVYGRVRVGAFALLFAGDAWVPISVDGIEVAEVAEGWRLRDASVVDLRFEALGAAAELAANGSFRGREQLCRVRGTVGGQSVDCLGQVGQVREEPDWSGISATRSIAVWLDEGLGVTLSGARPSGARHHAEEDVAAALLLRDGAVPVEEPRLSTTYAGDWRPLRAGLELWVRSDDPIPQRLAGEAVCGSSVALGSRRLACSFFRWHMDGRQGVGVYDVVTQA